jgi:hypothetical protein
MLPQLGSNYHFQDVMWYQTKLISKKHQNISSIRENEKFVGLGLSLSGLYSGSCSRHLIKNVDGMGIAIFHLDYRIFNGLDNHLAPAIFFWMIVW